MICICRIIFDNVFHLFGIFLTLSPFYLYKTLFLFENRKRLYSEFENHQKKVSLWNYEPKMKKKFFRIKIVIFSNMYMNFCTKNEKKNPCRGFVGNFGDLCSFQTLWCCTRSMKSDISTLLLIFLKRQKNKRFPSNSRWTK